ncbi:MAG: phosphodiester glycosidase family protein [Anaerolineales bacterium]|nr:phosphodiester glycosidase family protein [Anaerolineales bacterium]
MNTVIGPDISFYQDEPKTPQGVDFVRMNAASDFVIVRAGQNLWVDPKFKLHWQESKLAGIPRGCYWFYDSRANPKRQAELWFESLGADLGELPLFADFEENYQGEFGGWKCWHDFLERLKTLVGKKEIGIYTAFYYWRDHAPNATTQTVNLAYFAQYPLWIANYATNKPLVPQPWGENDWLFWQFTEIGNGKAYGVETQGIDLNYFNGSPELFKKRFDESLVVPPSIPGSTPISQVPPLSLEIPPCDPIGNLYRVITNVLNMRQGPGTGYDIVSQLPMDTVVQGLRITRDRKWVEVETRDGVNGWCYATYLQAVNGARIAAPFKLQLFENVLFIRETFSKPRKLVVNILLIDLHAENLEFLVTPSNGLRDFPLCSRTTSQFLTQYRAQIAINGDGFSYKPIDRQHNPCPNAGSPVKPNGLAASRGHIYSELAKTQPTLYISKKNEMSFNTAPNEIYNAISGHQMLVTKGELQAGLTANSSIEPRTAIGVSRNGRWFWSIVADGRQPGHSEGATLVEMANLMLRFGAYNAMNLDGGGSTAMSMEGFNGKAINLNMPFDQEAGIQRPVANHLGIYLRRKKK